MAAPAGIPPLSKPARDVRARSDLRAAPAAAPRLPLRAPAHPAQRDRDEHRACGAGGRAVLAGRVARVPAGPDADRPARRRGGRVALLCPAPVRGHLLAERRRLELRRRGAAGQQLPEAAAVAPVLLGQHRVAPRAPPQHQGPQLQPAARARPESDLPRRADALAVGRSSRRAAQALGRGSWAAGDLRRGARANPPSRGDGRSRRPRVHLLADRSHLPAQSGRACGLQRRQVRR